MSIISKQKLEFLLLRYMEDKATSEEREELGQYLLNQDNEDSILEIMEELLVTEDVMHDYDDKNWGPLLEKLLQKINTLKQTGQTIVIKWKRIVATASILFVVVLSGYLALFRTDTEQVRLIKATQPIDVKAPENNRAMITLSNGQKVYLDSAINGSLLQQAGVVVMKLADGKIVYEGSSKEYINNTLTNPKGSKVIDITLSDGSRIWLNAGSSLTYPVAFVGNERKVSIIGEAYFEVMKDKKRPFKVDISGKGEVEVLGTHFNINAYDDEANIKVTLLEGSLKVNNTLIEPGQQVQASDKVKIIENVDLEEVIAWKNDMFIFNNQDIKTIMHQISRWYDLEIIYQVNNSKKTYSGMVSRNNKISKVLMILEKAGIKFKIEERKLTIMEK